MPDNQKKVGLIVAMAKNRAIGKNNDLLWHLPNDLKFFKKTTSGHAILMGRKTFESIGKPLPNRENIVVTRDRNYSAEGVTVVHDIEEGIKRATSDVVFIGGGGHIYEQAMPMVSEMYVTLVDETIPGDTFFPDIDWEEWIMEWSEFHQQDEKNPFHHAFFKYKRKI